jgi:hypothetical protein
MEGDGAVGGELLAKKTNANRVMSAFTKNFLQAQLQEYMHINGNNL